MGIQSVSADNNQNYKETLNLPVTNFPMKANLVQREPIQLKHWESWKLYQKMQQIEPKEPVFVLHDGPPYANGDIHIGHALNKILKDTIIKSKRLAGYAIHYRPGWDCHGLPIELNVEKKIGRPGQKLTIEAFRKYCRKYAQTQLEKQRDSFKRLGVIGDWQHPYRTMDYDYEANTIRALADVVEAGYLSRNFKPVYWCCQCCSALAEAEVEYMPKTSQAIDVAFTVIDSLALAACFTDQGAEQSIMSLLEESPLVWIPIWTTTPWTLLSNQALAVHPNYKYILLQASWRGKSIRLIIAESRLDALVSHYQLEKCQLLGKLQGKQLEGLLVQHPLIERQVPVVLADYVMLEDGTGIVHTAPAHGEDDYWTGKKYDLPITTRLKDNGVFEDEEIFVGGQHFSKADYFMINQLKEKGCLLQQAVIEHRYPHCWRHKKPIIFKATPQWFIHLDHKGLRKRALQAIQTIEWIPGWGRERMQKMLTDHPDWCLSRQNRAWGTPMALLRHKETDELHPEMPKIMRKVADQVAEKGIDAWSHLRLEDLLEQNEVASYIKVDDTLDVWFDSGVSHTCVLTKEEGLTLPIQLYLEGSDQYRGWFQSSLLTSLMLQPQVAYRCVLTHGFTVDATGHKMSKSLGNTIAPQKIVQKFGADILRLWVASADYRAEVAISDEILSRLVDIYRRIRNTVRFLFANTADFEVGKHKIAIDDCLELDRWIIRYAANLQSKLEEAYAAYQFHLVVNEVHQFCNQVLGHFYLDIIKDRQYTLAKNSRARRSAQMTMYHVLQGLVRWIAPILSFTAEEIWSYMPDVLMQSVFLSNWYNFPSSKLKPSISDQSWDYFLMVKESVNLALESLRSSGGIGSSLQARVNLYVDQEGYAHLEQLHDELRFLLITSEAHLEKDTKRPKQASATAHKGLFLMVEPVAHNKCIRCWHYIADVGQNQKHPQLCQRCIMNLSLSNEESRYYV